MKLAVQAPLWFRIINLIFLGLIVFSMLYPIINLCAVSLSSSTAVLSGSVGLFPKDVTTKAYKEIIEQKRFWLGYRNSFFYMVMGTTIALTITVMAAYPLSRKNLVGKGVIMKIMVFTMFFNGGLIPAFIVVKALGLYNTIWALLLPGASNAFYIVMMRTFFMGIPDSLSEAAEIDGLSQIGILFRVVLPLSKPIIAAIALFNAVWYWNDWFQALIYLTNDKLYPVTMYLRNIMLGNMMSSQAGMSVDITSTQTISETLKAASTMLVILPMLAIYPFVQKHFVKGVMIGSIKG